MQEQLGGGNGELKAALQTEIDATGAIFNEVQQ